MTEVPWYIFKEWAKIPRKLIAGILAAVEVGRESVDNPSEGIARDCGEACRPFPSYCPPRTGLSINCYAPGFSGLSGWRRVGVFRCQDKNFFSPLGLCCDWQESGVLVLKFEAFLPEANAVKVEAAAPHTRG